MKVYLEQPKTILLIYVKDIETGKVVDTPEGPAVFFDEEYARAFCDREGFDVVEIRGNFEGPENPDFKNSETFWSKIEKKY